LGHEVALEIEVPPDATDEDIKKLVWDQMRLCFDPEIPVNIVELGLIYSCEVEKDTDGQRIAKIAMTLTAPGCGMGEVLVADVREKVEVIPTIKQVEVELTFDPPWNQTMMSEVARLQTGMM
jgi:probable FeS assembly SUF system protein SufT